MLTIFDVKGVGPTTGTGLTEKGITTAEQLANAEVVELLSVPGIGESRAGRLIEAAKAALIPEPVSNIAAAPVKAPVPDMPPTAAAPKKTKPKKADKKKPKKDKKKDAKSAKKKEKAKSAEKTEKKAPKKDSKAKKKDKKGGSKKKEKKSSNKGAKKKNK